MKHTLILALLLLGCSFMRSGELSAHIEKIYFLKGKLGERDLAIKMFCYDELPTRYITYFFLDDKKDRYLLGTYKDNFWNFLPDEQDWKSMGKPAVTLKLTESTQHTWKGTWSDGLGKSRDLLLSEIIPDTGSADLKDLPFFQEIEPYEQYRLANIHFSKTKTEKKSNDLLCDWYLEKESGISFFRLRSGNNKLPTGEVNVALRTIHLFLVQKYLSTKAVTTGAKIETSLLYLTNELASFRILSTYTLHTGKLSQSRQLITYDMKSGQQVDLEQLISFEKGAAKPPLNDMYKIYKYRKDVFAPKVFHLLQELYPDKMKTDSCGINKAETWALPVWNLTNKGITFGFMNADQCNVLDWAIIPYEKLEPYLEEGYHIKAK